MFLCHSFIQSFIHSFIHSFIYSSIHPFIYLFIHLFIMFHCYVTTVEVQIIKQKATNIQLLMKTRIMWEMCHLLQICSSLMLPLLYDLQWLRIKSNNNSSRQNLLVCQTRFILLKILDTMIYLVISTQMLRGARCSSMVRAFAHGAMGRRIDPSWGGPIELFLIPASAP